MANVAHQFSSAKLLSLSTIVLLAVSALLDAWSVVAIRGHMYLDADEPPPVAIVYGLLAVLTLAVYLATAVVFCMWVHRVVKNLPALGAYDLEFTPSRAVWAFFIPFINLVRPWHALQEVWKASNPRLSDNGASSRKSVADAKVVTAWWALFLLSNFAQHISARDNFTPERAMSFALIGHILSIAAAVAAIAMVRRIHAFQLARLGRETTASSATSLLPEPAA